MDGLGGASYKNLKNHHRFLRERGKIQTPSSDSARRYILDSRLRGNDGVGSDGTVIPAKAGIQNLSRTPSAERAWIPNRRTTAFAGMTEPFDPTPSFPRRRESRMSRRAPSPERLWIPAFARMTAVVDLFPSFPRKRRFDDSKSRMPRRAPPPERLWIPACAGMTVVRQASASLLRAKTQQP